MTNHLSNRVSGCMLIAAAVLGLTIASPSGAADSRALARIAGTVHNNAASALPVQSRPYGMTYGEWSARWWQWAFSLPNSGTPLFGTADCRAGQSGHVWFLAGHAVGEPGPSPNCTVPAGTALFVSVINGECSNLEGSGTTEGELRACADFIGTLIDPNTLSASLDGQSITGLSHYLVESPFFSFGPLPADNLITYFCVDQGEGCPAAPAGSTGVAVGTGVYLMLNPLSVGTHTLKFHGEIPAANYVIDTTYYLTVTP
jgi:hypothetical protein